MPPFASSTPATNIVPSAEEATHPQFLAGALVACQVSPEFVEM
jgi:hypothetical protein